VKKGSAVLRDLRLWHAGLPNPSADARIMLAFVHFPWVRLRSNPPCPQKTNWTQWYKAGAKVVLPESARDKVESWRSRKNAPVNYAAHFVPANLDHQKVKFTPNFHSTNTGYNSMLPNLPMGFMFTDEAGAEVKGM
jgi:hypothetical protein